MLLATRTNLGPRHTQHPNGCTLGSGVMACYGHGHDPDALYEHLRVRFARVVAERGGVPFPLVVDELVELGLPAEYGRGTYDEACAQSRRGRVVLGVDPSVLYPGARPGLHAVYLAQTTQTIDDLPPIVLAGMRQPLEVIAATAIRDPEPSLPDWQTVSQAVLRAAFAGEWFVVLFPSRTAQGGAFVYPRR